MSSVQFIFGIHNHQPVGNFDFVFEEAYQKSYKPFLDVYESFPDLALVIHLSGCLIEWLEAHHPEYLDRIRTLVAHRQLEILSAGFYEPVLAIIPDRDKRGQIAKMNQYIAERFQYQAQGLWLTERVWEPHLSRPLHEAGIRYLTVDDFHFLSAGRSREEMTGYFMTEEQGYPTGVFPISQHLRYAMPFQEPEATIAHLKSLATDKGDRVIVMADDGEKFGVWPGTYDRCYEKDRWLERFFQALQDNRDWLKTTTFKEYFHIFPPRGRVYLPTVSYFEMSEWTLPAEKGERFSALVHNMESAGTLDKNKSFLRGGTWRNFQSLYDESNWIQKRMVQVSDRLAQAMADSPSAAALTAAQDDLWRAQCNCAYWHGVFGGLYLPHLRHAIYTQLLKAESALQQDSDNATGDDLDLDGGREFVLQSDQLKIITGEKGGLIRELDYLPRFFNLADTMRRYAESYHSKISQAKTEASTDGSIHDIVTAKENGLEKYLQTDTLPRAILVDHFFPSDLHVVDLTAHCPEQGNFNDAFFTATSGLPLDQIELSAVGMVGSLPVAVKKQMKLAGNELKITIQVTNRSQDVLTGLYGNELNFSLLGGHTPDRYYLINGEKPSNHLLDSQGESRNVRALALVNEWDQFAVTLYFPHPETVWRHPVFTVSMSESGFEKIYQSSAVIPIRPLTLDPDETMTMEFLLKVDEWI
ncbi:MAG: alpha-amylase/4-alpha-glucanotransferase domain-containing protein [Fidelibacterota bacterium]